MRNLQNLSTGTALALVGAAIILLSLGLLPWLEGPDLSLTGLELINSSFEIYDFRFLIVPLLAGFLALAISVWYALNTAESAVSRRIVAGAGAVILAICALFTLNLWANPVDETTPGVGAGVWAAAAGALGLVVQMWIDVPLGALSGSVAEIDWKQQFFAYLFLSPALVLFALFAWNPIISSLIYSLQKVKLQGGSTWIGFRNFERMLADPAFEDAWRNSFEFAVLSILIGFFVPIFVAILVNEMRHGKGFFRVVYFLPSVIPPVIALLVWQLIYAPEGGLLNEFISALGGQSQLWLQNKALVKPSLLVIMTWGGFGGTMLIYLAALQNVQAELYEAAEIDGASPLHRVYHITLPQLWPTMKIMLILQIIGVGQVFLEPFTLTDGGPGRATTTPVLVIYNKAFRNYDFGLASAWSVLLIVVLAIFSAVYLRLTRETE